MLATMGDERRVVFEGVLLGVVAAVAVAAAIKEPCP
jgi:hypothetical protein